jgi:sec-independent protein translocase protein TatB
MFDFSFGELLLIGIVALVAIGPKELPGVLRTLGQWTAKLRRMAAEFQNQFQEAMREAEMADLKKQVDEVTSQAKSYANFDPVGEVRREFESTQHQIERAITEKPAVEPSSPVSTNPVSTNDVVSAPTVTPTGTEPPVAAGSDADAAPAAAASEQRAAGAPDAGGNPA